MTAIILPALRLPFPCFLALVGAALLAVLYQIWKRSKNQNKSS